MSEPNQQGTTNAQPRVGSQDIYHAPDAYTSVHESIVVEKSSKRAAGALVVALGLIAVVGLIVITVTQKQFFSMKAAPADSDDMGQGVANASGIRGHLVTRWQKGKVQYMLKMEPLDGRNAAGFSAVASNPPKPISINVRLLDAAGFALCGKQILLHYPAQRTPQAAGTDVFQNIQGNDGSVEALWAQGELPCSPDQYRKFDYWDLSTNFPTLAEQDALLGKRPASSAGSARTVATAGGISGRRKPAVKAQASLFFVEGDDQISMYEPGRALLTGDSGHSFFIPVKSDQAVAANWAANYSHIHFRCDQHANCALRGGSGEILGRMSD